MQSCDMLTLRGNIAVSGSRLIYGVKASSQKNDHNPMDAIQLNYLTTTPPPPHPWWVQWCWVSFWWKARQIVMPSPPGWGLGNGLVSHPLKKVAFLKPDTLFQDISGEKVEASQIPPRWQHSFCELPAWGQCDISSWKLNRGPRPPIPFSCPNRYWASGTGMYISCTQ